MLVLTKRAYEIGKGVVRLHLHIVITRTRQWAAGAICLPAKQALQVFGNLLACLLSHCTVFT